MHFEILKDLNQKMNYKRCKLGCRWNKWTNQHFEAMRFEKNLSSVEHTVWCRRSSILGPDFKEAHLTFDCPTTIKMAAVHRAGGTELGWGGEMTPSPFRQEVKLLFFLMSSISGSLPPSDFLIFRRHWLQESIVYILAGKNRELWPALLDNVLLNSLYTYPIPTTGQYFTPKP